MRGPAAAGPPGPTGGAPAPSPSAPAVGRWRGPWSWLRVWLHVGRRSRSRRVVAHDITRPLAWPIDRALNIFQGHDQAGRPPAERRCRNRLWLGVREVDLSAGHRIARGVDREHRRPPGKLDAVRVEAAGGFKEMIFDVDVATAGNAA